MRPLVGWHLVLVAFAAGFIALLVSLTVLTVGGTPVLVAPTLGLVFVFLGAVLTWAGVHVRRFKAHKTTWMTALRAMRVAVAARASAYVGALSAGVLIGLALACLSRPDASILLLNAFAAGLSALAAAAWAIAAVLVERWCAVDSDDDPKEGAEPGNPTVSPA